VILPTKRISADRSLIAVGGDVLVLLSPEEKTVTQLWTEFQRLRSERRAAAIVTYDWFVLALDLLFALGAVEWRDGVIRRSAARIARDVSTT
jgi:hypothetical protein